MGLILAIDPGTTESAYVWYEAGIIKRRAKLENRLLLAMLEAWAKIDVPAIPDVPVVDSCVIEGIASYGRPVGAEVFTTAIWIGRFMQAWAAGHNGHPPVLVYRREVKRHLCGTDFRITDAIIRQRLIDLFGPGKAVAIGTKKTPGPLYGLKSDEWSALALAVTFAGQGTSP